MSQFTEHDTGTEIYLHEVDGLIFGRTIQYNDGLKKKVITYRSYDLDTFNNFTELLKAGVTGLILNHSRIGTDLPITPINETTEGAYVRTGVGGQHHYYPLVDIVNEVLKGGADRWKRRKMRSLAEALAIPMGNDGDQK